MSKDEAKKLTPGERLRLAESAYQHADLAHRRYPTQRSREVVRRALEELGKARELRELIGDKS